MNKSEIIAQAKVEKHLTNFIDKCMTQGLIHDDEVRGMIAWIFKQSPAARLLEIVEVVEEGSEPMIGDVYQLIDYAKQSKFVEGRGMVEFLKISVFYRGDSFPEEGHHKLGKKIIQRNGKPVITIKKGEVC